MEASGCCDGEAAIAGGDVIKAIMCRGGRLVLGQLSSARQAQQLTDESKRPPRLMDPVPSETKSHSLRVSFALDIDKFLLNVRSTKRLRQDFGMTVEHLRPLLGSAKDQQLAEQVSRGGITPTVIEAMTALRKANGGSEESSSEMWRRGWLRAPWPSTWDHRWRPQQHHS